MVNEQLKIKLEQLKKLNKGKLTENSLLLTCTCGTVSKILFEIAEDDGKYYIINMTNGSITIEDIKSIVSDKKDLVKKVQDKQEELKGPGSKLEIN